MVVVLLFLQLNSRPLIFLPDSHEMDIHTAESLMFRHSRTIDSKNSLENVTNWRKDNQYSTRLMTTNGFMRSSVKSYITKASEYHHHECDESDNIDD